MLPLPWRHCIQGVARGYRPALFRLIIGGRSAPRQVELDSGSALRAGYRRRQGSRAVELRPEETLQWREGWPYSSLAKLEKSSWFDNPKIRALAEATYFPALRKAGLSEE